MADTPDTPKTDTTAAKPVRRRAPRTTAAKPSAKATTAKTAATKPAAAKSAATKTTQPETVAKPTPAKTPKPRSTKRATPHATAKPTAKRSTAKSDDKSAKGWGMTAAVAGGIAAIGAAATAAVLSLRGSTAKDDAAGKPDKGAHQADGSDSSKSFKAGIADEGSVPN